MKDFLTYLSTAPVVMTAWLTFTAGFIIEINRLNPDALVNQTFPFQ
jgi:photosystem I subunit 9